MSKETIKINLITYNNQYGLTNDMKMLAKLLEKHFKNKIEINLVDFFHYKAPRADINIFLETISKILFKYADTNILIPNQEWFYKTWIPYLDDIDYILTKTKYADELFKNIIVNNNSNNSKRDKNEIVKYIGWKSLDRKNQVEKDFNHFLHLCGRSKHKQTQEIINYWQEDFPKLTIVYSPKDVKINKRLLPNITYITERLNEDELINLINLCGVHLCCSETEGYGHYIHEAKSAGSIVITTNAPPMKDFIDNSIGYLIKSSDKKPLKKHLGSRYLIDENDFKKVIKEVQFDIINDLKKIKKMSENSRLSYLKEAKIFEDNIKDLFTEFFKLKRSDEDIKLELNKMKELINDDTLPTVSIITPTYNRRHFFKLTLTNFLNTRYPKDKLEWIVIDDGTDKVNDIFENTSEIKDDSRVKYFSLDDKKTIGFKRNFGVEKASGEYIVFMDDDDYYPPNSVKLRVLELLKSNKDCLVCSAIGCFDINKYVSMVNVPPHRLPFSNRISEASMCFKKSFWEEQKFNDSATHSEAIDFLNGRENKTQEISWEGIFVALLHNRNSTDKIMIDQTPNGCHYGWSDELFLFITSLDKELTQYEEKEKLKSKKKRLTNEDKENDGHLPNG